MIAAILKALSRSSGLLAERAVAGLATLAGWVWYHLLRYRRGVLHQNLALAFPERTSAERAALARAACTHLARTVLEFLRIPRYARAGFEGVVRVEGLEHCRAALREGRGVLGLTGHLGSFELIASAVAQRLDEPVSVVVKSFPRSVEGFITWIRGSTRLGLIPARGGMKAILRALRGGEVVIFVLDQNATRRLGVFVEFFGKPACTMSALAVIAARTGAPVVPSAMWREPNGAHVLQVYPPIPLEAAETPEATIERMTQRYTEFLEARIREHPEQWLWTHKRWRTRPEGEAQYS